MVCNLLTVSCHLHLHLRPLVHADAKVQPHVDDGDHEQQKEGNHQDQGFKQHRPENKQIVRLDFKKIYN